jgi:hypothetical protein
MQYEKKLTSRQSMCFSILKEIIMQINVIFANTSFSVNIGHLNLQMLGTLDHIFFCVDWLLSLLV